MVHHRGVPGILHTLGVVLARSLKKRADSAGASQPGLSSLTDPCAELQTATHGAAPLVTPGATTTFATAELARVLAELRASQSGSEEQKDKESEDEDTVRAFLALIDQQAGSASCRGDAPYVHHDSCGGAPQPAASATEKERMAAVFEKLRIENEECLEALMDQHARQSEASKKESEMWDRRWKEKEGVFHELIVRLEHGATCSQSPADCSQSLAVCSGAGKSREACKGLAVWSWR